MSQIFVSYSRRDLETVDSIVEKIETAGMGVWIDRDDIKAGKTWRVQIVQAIATCDAFVLMLSSNSAASDNVRREIDLAQDAGRAIFIMKLDRVKLPAEMLYQLVGLQHIDVQQLGIIEAFHRLMDTLDEHLASWKPNDDRTMRQVELVFQAGARTEFGAKKKAEMLGLISALTETPKSQLDIANLEAGGVHVFVGMPTTAAFELKTRALNRNGRLKRFGVKSLRIVGDKQYINVSFGGLTETATVGTFNMLWRSMPSLFPSLFDVAVGKIIVISTVVVVTTAASVALAASIQPNLSPAQMTPLVTNPPGYDATLPPSGEEMATSISPPTESSVPTSASAPTVPPVGSPLPVQTIMPTPSSTKTSVVIPPTSDPSPTPISTKTSTGSLFITNEIAQAVMSTDTPPPTYTPIPSDTAIPTNTAIPTDTPTPTPTATILPPDNEPMGIGGWTHINPGPGEVGNGQTFIPSEPNLLTVDVSILTGNPGRGDDTITLKILSADQQVLGTSSQLVADGFDGWLHFQFPDAGIMVTPGDTFIIVLQDTGKTTFGWRYIGDTYPNGHAIMLGSDEPSYDFFFRINR